MSQYSNHNDEATTFRPEGEDGPDLSDWRDYEAYLDSQAEEASGQCFPDDLGPALYRLPEGPPAVYGDVA